MATSEEKQQLAEELKGPHFYKLMLHGHGAETSYMYITEEEFNFWSKHTEENGDSDAINYIMGAEDRTPAEANEDEDLEVEIPRNAMFMHDPEDEESGGYNWYEPREEFEHVWGLTSEAAYITVDKVESGEYNAGHVKDIIEGEDFYEWANNLTEKTDYEVEPYVEGHDYGDRYPEKGRYICQAMSSEKGTFFEGVIETPGLFDENKLKFAVAEAPNGEDVIYAVEYNGEEVDNDGGDTTGKGYYVYFYQQDF